LFRLEWLVSWPVLIDPLYVFLFLCFNVNSRGKKGQQQPAPETVAAAATVGDVVGNGYYSIEKHKLDNDYGDDQSYEYASPSVMQEHEYSEPYFTLYDPGLGGSSVM